MNYYIEPEVNNDVVKVSIGNLLFDGPFVNAQDIRPEPGLYAIVCRVDQHVELVDLDESSCLSNCLDNDEYSSNLLFYSENSSTDLMAAVYYTGSLSQKERLELKYDLIAELTEKSMAAAC